MAEDFPRPMGALGAPFGVKGWIKLQSFASRPENLFDYSPWFIRLRGAEWREVQVEDYLPHSKGFVVKLNAVNTPEEAKALTGAEIGIRRSSLPPVAAGEFYLVDLIGCEVIGLEGVRLGKILRIRDHGASPILEVSPSDHLAQGRKDNILIPYVVGPIVSAIDLDAGIVRVEWGEDY